MVEGVEDPAFLPPGSTGEGMVALTSLSSNIPTAEPILLDPSPPPPAKPPIFSYSTTVETLATSPFVPPMASLHSVLHIHSSEELRLLNQAEVQAPLELLRHNLTSVFSCPFLRFSSCPNFIFIFLI